MVELLILGGLVGLGLFALRGARSDPPPSGAGTPARITFASTGAADVGPGIGVREGFDGIFNRVGARVGVEPRLLKAVAWVESRWNPEAVNPSDPSYGMMQIQCSGSGERCSNRLPAFPDWPPLRGSLFDPEESITWGARILLANRDFFGGDWDRAIVGYNNWSAAKVGPPYVGVARSYLEKVRTAHRDEPWRFAS